MIRRIVCVAMCVAVSVFAGQTANAEESVTISKMHLCCGACVKGVEGALEKVEGATVKVNQEEGTAVVTAKDRRTARRAIGAIARAGFHGVTDNEKLKMPANSGVKKGVVERLELVGVHNCCGGCNQAIKKALGTVEGVEADTAKPKAKSLVVEGKFDGLALITALNKAGFHVRAKGANRKAAAERKKKAEAEPAKKEKAEAAN